MSVGKKKYSVVKRILIIVIKDKNNIVQTNQDNEELIFSFDEL